MGIALLCLITVSVLIGIQAQTVKGRTGAGWGALAFIVMFILLVFFWRDQSTLRHSQNKEELLRVLDVFGQAGFAAILAIVIGGGAMSLIVAPLPKSRRASETAR